MQGFAYKLPCVYLLYSHRKLPQGPDVSGYTLINAGTDSTWKMHLDKIHVCSFDY